MLLFVASVCVYLTFSLPWYVDAAVLTALLVVAVRSTWREMALLLASLIVAAVLAQIVFSPNVVNAQLFYREHEKWYQDDRYRPNVADVISIPFGDLAAADPGAPASVYEPRRVAFFTDSLGYRNRSDYANQKVVLVGDSFVVGMGTDQDRILSEVLTNEFGLPAYEIGFPSGPSEYEGRAKAFLPRLAPGAVFAFMIFEGNDFDLDQPVKVGNLFDRARGRFLRDYAPFLNYPRVLFGMSRRAQARFGLAPDAWVEVHPLGEKPVAFSRFYIERALNPAPKYHAPGDPQVLERTACVFFIPEKYRVYKTSIDDGRVLPEPAPALAALKSFYEPHHIPVVDLTPALVAAARTLLNEGRYVFYRDDTHWNADGMRAVAPVVKDCLDRRLRAVR
jgi:SGNH hydrolase-like domain, acetyltransferase AlgX